MIKPKTEEYIAEIMPDGHLSLPEKIAERLNLKCYNRVRVIIKKSEESFLLSDKAKQKAVAIKKFISDMGPEDLSEKFRETYKMKTVFVDASAWIALYHKKDKYHNAAWLIYEQLLNEPVKFLTSNWVAYEAISFIKNRAGYEAAKVLWKILQDAELFQLEDIDKETEAKLLISFGSIGIKNGELWIVLQCF